MKGKVLGSFLMVLMLFSCNDAAQDGVKLSGNIENFSGSEFIHLELITETGVQKVDTLFADSEGNFNTYVQIEEPAFYRLNLNNRQYVMLVLNGAETEVTVNAHGNDPQGFSEVSGSYDTEYKNQMDYLVKDYRTLAQQYQQEALQARAGNDATTFMSRQEDLKNLTLQTEKKLKQLIWEATPSLAAFYGLQLIDAEKNYAFMDSVAREMLIAMPDNFHVTNLVENLNAKKTLAVGSVAPEIALPSPDGTIITLSSLRGNYVLIDFWAAWCRPCRAENPNVVRVYNQYSGANFEILGVSLDKTRDAWLKAIEQDGLPWLHVSDLKFWNSQAAQTYQIHSIPATYLIDPEGKIIAKNLRGPSLEAKLKEIFG